MKILETYNGKEYTMNTDVFQKCASYKYEDGRIN